MNLSRTLSSALVTLVALVLAGPLAAGPASADNGTLLQYSRKHGSVSLLSVDDPTKLAGAPASFRSFAKSSMKHEWRTYLHGRPACKAVPRIQVFALRTDGFAMGAVNDQPQPGCQSGGGYVAIWAVRQGAWKEVIGTQDVPTCARLERFDIPSEIGVDQCYDGHDVVTYSHS